MKQLFISDLHLDEARPDLTGGLIRFLDEEARAADKLYILGDFFEAWLGDDHDTSFNRSIIDALASLSADKFIMHGNRDFLLGQDFCRAAGARLLDDPTVIDLPQGPALLMHGDSLCTRDTAYMEARKTLRSTAFQEDFLAKTLEEREAFARELRGKSRNHTRETAADIMDVTPTEVENIMTACNVRTLIHGHTHRPAVHQLEINGQTAWRYVLGDWDRSMQYLVVTETVTELKSFQIS